MSNTPEKITFYFDFLCPFAYRSALWIDMVQEQLGDALTIDWRYFSLEQQNTPDELNWNIWDQPEDYQPQSTYPADIDMRALLAFWGAEAARQQGTAAFDRFRVALYHARHRDQINFTRANVEQIAEQVELDMEQFRRDFADRRMIDELRRSHLEAVETYKVFGVPTLLFNGEQPLFIKMMAVPPAEEAIPTLREIQEHFLPATRDWLAEVKRSDPGKLR